jgi:hypothetical protein
MVKLCTGFLARTPRRGGKTGCALAETIVTPDGGARRLPSFSTDSQWLPPARAGGLDL